MGVKSAMESVSCGPGLLLVGDLGTWRRVKGNVSKKVPQKQTNPYIWSKYDKIENGDI